MKAKGLRQMLRSRSGSRQPDPLPPGGNNHLDCVIAPPAEFHDNAEATKSTQHEEKILNIEPGKFVCKCWKLWASRREQIRIVVRVNLVGLVDSLTLQCTIERRQITHDYLDGWSDHRYFHCAWGVSKLLKVLGNIRVIPNCSFPRSLHLHRFWNLANNPFSIK